MKMKTIKIDEFTYDCLSSARDLAKREKKEAVTLGEMISSSLEWRNAVKVTKTDEELKFNIRFIEFREFMKEFETGIYPVAKYADLPYVERMIESSRVVIHDEKIRVLFSYPMSHTVEEVHEKKEGFSRADILEIVGIGYAKIYAEESSTMKEMEESKFTHNRGRSNGIHGIYGHVIDDLWLEYLVYDRKSGVLTLGIGS